MQKQKTIKMMRRFVMPTIFCRTHIGKDDKASCDDCNTPFVYLETCRIALALCIFETPCCDIQMQTLRFCKRCIPEPPVIGNGFSEGLLKTIVATAINDLDDEKSPFFDTNALKRIVAHINAKYIDKLLAGRDRLCDWCASRYDSKFVCSVCKCSWYCSTQCQFQASRYLGKDVKCSKPTEVIPMDLVRDIVLEIPIEIPAPEIEEDNNKEVTISKLLKYSLLH